MSCTFDSEGTKLVPKIESKGELASILFAGPVQEDDILRYQFCRRSCALTN
jgi:predicted ATPase